MAKNSNIAVLLTTLDEEANLPHALASVAGWADEVFVVDCGSTDDTVALAKASGATVVHHDWPGYGKQKNWGMENLPIQSDWILLLDADESVEPELRDALLDVAAKPLDAVEHAAFEINRYFVFLGQRIRHCGYYPSWNVRLVRRGRARYEDRDVHEHMIVDGTVGRLPGHLRHDDRRGLEHYMAKHNHYSTLEAREIVSDAAKREQGAALLEGSPFGDAAARRRWIKRRIYPHLPAKWLWRFAYMYFLRLGILDGLTGLRFCLFMSAYELLIGLKIVELKKQRKIDSPQRREEHKAEKQ